MTAADAAYKVLADAGEPLHYKEITDRILVAGLWTTAGRTPWSTVGKTITDEIKRDGPKSRFVKGAPGVFAVREILAEPTSSTPGEPSRPGPKSPSRQMTFLDAAEHVRPVMTAANAAYRVLADAAEPLHYKEITDRILAAGSWTTDGRTPWSTVAARIADEIKRDGSKSRFVKRAPGVFAVREIVAGPASSRPGEASRPAPKPPGRQMTFLDAAERVLQGLNVGARMHYGEVTKRALETGLIVTKGKTPESTMLALVTIDVRRRDESGDPQRFVNRRGMIGLAEKLPVGIAGQIREHNVKARTELLRRAKEGTAGDFEKLVESLLHALGFEEVERTKMGTDGGVDVRGTLVVGDVVRIRMAVQAKKLTSDNVLRPVVQQLRGALGANEQGLIITTSGFSKGAREEAARTGVSPVALMDGQQLAVLLAKHQVGAGRREHVLIVLDPPESGNESS